MDYFLKGIAVDAAHSVKNSRTEIQGVDLETGEVIFYQNLGNQTVNIGEFLAIIEGCKYIIKNHIEPPVLYSDSKTAITWFKNKASASCKRNRFVQEGEIYLKACATLVDKIEIRHWDSKLMGENAADFGNKK